MSSSRGCEDDVVEGPGAEKRGSIYPSSASAQANYEEKVDAELDDGQFLVDSLLGKRVRRVRGRKVVHYFVKWKGYSDEENTWEDKKDIHEDLIEDYEGARAST